MVKIPLKHEERSCWIFKAMVRKYSLPFTNSDIEFICDKCILHPNPNVWYTCIIYNPFSSIDVDKIDYLRRDSHALKISTKDTFDPSKLFDGVKLVDKNNEKIVFCRKTTMIDLEKLFQERDYFHTKVYRHEAVQNIENYLIMKLLQKQNIAKILYYCTLDDFLKMTDESLLSFLSQEELEVLQSKNWNEWAVPNIVEKLLSSYQDNQSMLAFKKYKSRLECHKKKSSKKKRKKRNSRKQKKK